MDVRIRDRPCLAEIALALSDPLEERCNRRPIRRTLPDMMQGHLSRGVHENVSPQLVDVASGTPQPVAPADQLDVRPPGGGSPDRRPSTAPHSIGAIEDAPPVDQQGPPETRLAHILLGTLSGLESHDDDLEAQPLDLVLVPSQLRQVLTAGQSAEVAVEDHQQPAAAKLLEPMHRAGGVLQRERDGRRSDQAFHFALARLPPAARLAGLPIVFQTRGASLERRNPSLEAVQSPRLLVEPPVQRFLMTSHSNRNASELSTKQLANLINVPAEIGVRRANLVAEACGQLGKVHGPSLAALPHLVNIASRLRSAGVSPA